MERDALIAHGISYALHDRLLNCSDYSEGYVCKKCGNMLSSYSKVTQRPDFGF
jgi:DNA-directed RNA polymerase I subunit RPA2